MVRLLLAVAAVAVETTMVVAGSRPDAELEGLLLPLGLAAAVVTLPYLAVTVVAIVGLARAGGAGVRPTTALAVVDVVVGAVLVGVLVRAMVIGDAWAKSPLWFGLVPLVLGALTLALARRAIPTPVAP